MRKLIYAVVLVLMFSSIAYAHRYCGEACDQVYKEISDDQLIIYGAKGCAAWRILEEFSSFELMLGENDLGRIVEKSKYFSKITKSQIIILAHTPNKLKPLEAQIMIFISAFPQPGLNTVMSIDVQFDSYDYKNFECQIQSELSGSRGGRSVRPENVYGMFEYMVEAYKTIKVD